MELSKLTPKQISELIALLLELNKKTWVEVKDSHKKRLGNLLDYVPTVTQGGVTYFNKPNNYWWFHNLGKDLISYLNKTIVKGE